MLRRATFLLPLAAGCGANPASIEAASSRAPDSGVHSYKPPPPCRTREACLDEGRRALGAGRDDARLLLGLACEKKSVSGCLELGRAYATGAGGPQDRQAARQALMPLCPERNAGSASDVCSSPPTDNVASDTCLPDACAWLLAVAGPDDHRRAMYAERGCATDRGRSKDTMQVRGRACFALAKAHEAAARGSDAHRAYENACALGIAEACDLALKSPSAKPTTEHDGGTLEVPSLITDGLEMRDVVCKLEGGAFLGVVGGLTVAAGFSRKKAALERCSPDPYDVMLGWTADGGRVTNVTAESRDSRLRSCVESALVGVPSVPTGTCRAKLVVAGRRSSPARR